METSDLIALGGLAVAILAMVLSISVIWFERRVRIRIGVARSEFIDPADGVVKRGFSFTVINYSRFPVFVSGTELWGAVIAPDLSAYLDGRTDPRSGMTKRQWKRYRAHFRHSIGRVSNSPTRVDAFDAFERNMVCDWTRVSAVDPRDWGVGVSLQSGKRICLDGVDLDRGYRGWFRLLRTVMLGRYKDKLRNLPVRLVLEAGYKRERFDPIQKNIAEERVRRQESAKADSSSNSE